MTVISTITDAISLGLNRSVPDNLTRTVVQIYKTSGGKEAFGKATKAIGFLEDLARKTYVLINDNIASIDRELGVVEAKLPKESKKDKPESKSEKKGKRLLALEFEDFELPIAAVKETAPKKFVFKKIKKERAAQVKSIPVKQEDSQVVKQENSIAVKQEGKTEFKQEVKSESHSSDPKLEHELRAMLQQKFGTAPTKPSLAQLAQLEREAAETDFVVEDLGDIENDRDWYTEESNALEQYDDVEEKPKKVVRPSQQSGGKFDAETGEYVDYDHVAGAVRIPIVSHHLVPPFLEGQEELLSMQGTLRNSISVVLDPQSELALSARNGSYVVKERKEKRERAQQAKDRTGETRREEKEKEQKHDEEAVVEDDEPATFETIQKQRHRLPAYTAKLELMRTIAENQIVVVIGETGSGKTTQITQFLADEYAEAGQIVGCTQPRRVAAMLVAKRVSEEVGCRLGDRVGYAIRFEDKTSSNTVIKYMTDGILLREMLQDPNLDKYSCVVMDEAHERTLSTDILLGLFRQLLRRRRDLRLVVTSATMDANRFTGFFGEAPQFFIPGRTFPVDVLYAASACNDYVEAAVKQVVTLHLGSPPGDILVFMTGHEDIDATCELIEEKLLVLEDPPPLDVLPIYSSMPADLQKKIFSKPNEKRRKVVVATNIAETSLTVDGVKYVVDCGLSKVKVFNPRLAMDTLQVVPISLANAKQRSGRAGRTAPGIAYRLYTEAGAEQLRVQPLPEIQRTNLAAVMLMLKGLGVTDVLKFPFLDPPPPDLLACSLYDLWALGALDNVGNLTKLGGTLTVFPMDPALAKLVFLSCQPDFACLSEVLTIVAMLSVPSVFYRPKERAAEADAARERFLIAGLDHLTLLNVYTQWEQKGRNSSPHQLAVWTNRQFLHLKLLARAREVRNQLLVIMNHNKLPVVSTKNDDIIRRCLCAAYYHQLATLVRSNNGHAEYANLRHRYMKMHVHPTLALVGGGVAPQYVIYDELVLTSREYMQCATAVEPEWLLEYGYLFFGVSASVRRELGDLGFRIIDKSETEATLKRDQEKMKIVEVASKPKVVKKIIRRGF